MRATPEVQKLGTKTSRRSAIQAVGGASLGLLTALGATSISQSMTQIVEAAPVRVQGNSQPNIILIVADDMRADDLEDMPAANEHLIRQGCQFDQFFASVPSCAPSRASILRGQYPQNHGVLRGGEKEWGFGLFHELGRESSTIATWLQDAGYTTALFGKYLNNYPSGATPTYIPPGWNEWAGTTRAGYEKFELNEDGVLVSYHDPGHVYETDVLAAKAIDFVARTSASSTPFFMYVAPHAPHSRPVPAARHEGEFSAARPPRPPSFAHVDAGKPPWVQRLPALDTDEIARIDATYRARKETLLALDDLIAGLVEALGQAGILDNTYLVFTSDNGYHLGEHHISAGKGTAYDEAIRVPLVIRGPGLAPGRTSALASVIDLAPTIATWADVEFPAFVDGRSLTPVFSGQTGDWRKTVFAQLHRDNPDNDGPPAFRALRGDGFAYVEYSDGFRELYDLSTDPYELDSLATSVDPELITELSERVAVISRSAGAECRVAEDAPLPPELVAILGG